MKYKRILEAAKYRLVAADDHNPAYVNKVKSILKIVSNRVRFENSDDGLFEFVVPRGTDFIEVKQEVFKKLIALSKTKKYIFEFYVSPKGDLHFQFRADF